MFVHSSNAVLVMDMNLKGKKVLLGVTGGIAAYKAADLVRLFVKAGAEVRCVMTANARQFITPLTLQTLSRNAVYTDVFRSEGDITTEHISLAEWADFMVVAPATANIIGKFASGIADDALSTAFLAFEKPVIVAPAMNVAMYGNAIVQRNLDLLYDVSHVSIVGPAEGELACGTTGRGRMVSPETIVEFASRAAQLPRGEKGLRE